MSKIINDGIYEELTDLDTILDSDYYTTQVNNTPLPVPRNWLDVPYKKLKATNKATVYRYVGPAPAITEYLTGKVQLVANMACRLMCSGNYKTVEAAVTEAIAIIGNTKQQLTDNTKNESFRISGRTEPKYPK